MGYGLHYKIEPASDATAVNEWLDRQEETERFRSLGFYVEMSTEENELLFDTGEGYENFSPSFASNANEYLDRFADLFERLHTETEYEISVYSRSCVLLSEEYYFTGDQIRKISQDGSALTGSDVEEIRSRF